MEASKDHTQRQVNMLLMPSIVQWIMDDLKGVAERGKETNTRFFFFGALPDPPPPLPS